MINIVSAESATASKKVAFGAGNFDDTAVVTIGSILVDYTTLTADQKTAFDDFMTNIVGTHKNVSIINLPYNSDFSIDYITDSVSFTDSNQDYDYTALSGTSKGYIDAFNLLMIALLSA